MTENDKKSMLCPNCRRLISVDEPQCPYCGVSRPGSRWKHNFWTKGFRQPDQIIKAIIYTNAAMFLLSLVLRPRMPGLSANPLTFLAPDNTSLLLLGGTGSIPFDRLHRWWTLVSANYLHGGILHIAFNMIALSQIGYLIIREYGGYRMFTIYTLSGICGFWVSCLAGVPFTIGASAAICGLIGAALYYGKSRGGSYGRAIYSQVGGWAIMIFVFGLLVPGIDDWAHGGGIVSGALLGYLLGYEEKWRETLFHKMLAGVCLALTLAVLGWAVVSGVYYYLGG
jgi:rhomboid protease GluP